MTGKAPAAILVLLAVCLLVWAGCGDERAQENLTPSGTEDAPLSKESAIELVLDVVTGNPENKVDPSTAKADLMTEREAKETIWVRSGGPRVPAGFVVASGRLVWLVEMKGEFAGLEEYRGAPEPGGWAGTVLAYVTMDGLVESAIILLDRDAGQ